LYPATVENENCMRSLPPLNFPCDTLDSSMQSIDCLIMVMPFVHRLSELDDLATAMILHFLLVLILGIISKSFTDHP
jgi:hypothetical protein